MKILFAGSPEIAVPSLRKIARAWEVVGVLTNPDSRQGRGGRVEATPAARTAEELGLPVLKPQVLDAAFRDEVKELRPDLLVTAAYGKIFGPKFLGLFPLGGVNLHPSLLPRYRGSSPINAAILNGDNLTGLSIQKLALKMDTGDILAQEEHPLDGTETARLLTEVFAESGARLLLEVLEQIDSGTAESRPQDEAAASYCGIIKKEDGRIDWTKAARDIERRFRAYDPWPGVFTSYKGRKLNILKLKVYTKPAEYSKLDPPGTVLSADDSHGILIQTGEGLAAVSELQLESKKALDFRSFLNGNRDFLTSRLGGDS